MTESKKDRPDRPLEPAEIDVLKAEARKLEAEAREAAAKARVAELAASEREYTFERETEKRERERAVLERHHVYTYAEPVTAGSAEKCMKELNYWHRSAPGCDIEIIFNSPGGSVNAGMALYDYLQLLKDDHQITTTALGMAASMAGILLQAGHVRVMGREAYILIHEVQAGVIGDMGDIEDEVELLKKMQNRILDIFAERSTLTKSQLRTRWRRKQWWLDSREALKLKLVDEVR